MNETFDPVAFADQIDAAEVGGFPLGECLCVIGLETPDGAMPLRVSWKPGAMWWKLLSVLLRVRRA